MCSLCVFTQQINLERRNSEQTEEIAEITEKAYEAGTVTPFELREIQYGIVEARGRLLQAQLEYMTTQLNISLLIGDFQKLI